MLSPIALNLIIKHFDSIDRALSSKLARTSRPWDEAAINFLFTDLFDEKVQEEYSLIYPLKKLRKKLNKIDEKTSVELQIDAHSYSSAVEHYVTQSDIGLVIEYRDTFRSTKSRTSAWLLQAKRAFPISKVPLEYSSRSKFSSTDAEQQQRIDELRKFVGEDFIKYLLYCPRPEFLDDEERYVLSYLRREATGDSIFDYALGLELRDDIMNGSPTVAAGVFVSNTNAPPKDVAGVHQGLFKSNMPLSWFIAHHFTAESYYRYDDILTQAHDNDLALKIVTGDESVIHDIGKHFGKELEFQIFPPVTITVTVTDGLDLPNRRG
ncbi:hypothetical protein LJ656_27630 [Paraburkholderia sp. MMS20-SJTR3]|uniref:Uncharacterized protein n=1 Tax=Paraburkholderia sejongensis TaxID=2886946 RepID=A0ABS8K2I4_9BURK|nr:hypothetical protein [Paraburkholderia sp. MMS20-SJTR3]MCC8396367.1 hypothetical protein [Paraburkholderia sp. MMS20-SJTR3]